MTTTGFVARMAWQRWLILEEDGTQIPLHSTKLKGLVSLTCTPPWALHVTWSGASETQEKLKRALTRLHTSVVVVDLGPKALPGWSLQGLGRCPRHTRQLALNEAFEGALPKTRIKQARRFERESGTLEIHRIPMDGMTSSNFTLRRETKGPSCTPQEARSTDQGHFMHRLDLLCVGGTRRASASPSGGFIILQTTLASTLLAVKQGHKLLEGPLCPCSWKP